MLKFCQYVLLFEYPYLVHRLLCLRTFCDPILLQSYVLNLQNYMRIKTSQNRLVNYKHPLYPYFPHLIYIYIPHCLSIIINSVFVNVS